MPIGMRKKYTMLYLSLYIFSLPLKENIQLVVVKIFSLLLFFSLQIIIIQFYSFKHINTHTLSLSFISQFLIIYLYSRLSSFFCICCYLLRHYSRLYTCTNTYRENYMCPRIGLSPQNILRYLIFCI